MRVQYASDLHLEFGENSRWLKEHPLIPSADILVLAGDIGYLGDDNYISHPFWNRVSEDFNQVIVVPGNHELYKFFDINELRNGWQLEIRHNVRVCYNSVIALNEETDLIASTLWAHIPPSEEYLTERCVSDFKRIRNGEFRLSAQRFNEEHEVCRNFIEKAVSESNAERIVVATHHVPSFALMAEEFKDSSINGAFTVELAGMIAESRINCWIYGHSHRNIDKMIGSTRCVSNQLGYVFQNEHNTFRRDAVTEI
ncbi:serine/threonine protein phosphatase [Muribaculaceae bacterium Isolate-113 (HZI)]|mgnify:FL=1|jgi:Icc-related predicted phosphoesterase|uniref:metallophosphoesterase n=1 Tax=Bacteroidales TaxID=171549 RepID=UPI000F45F779|nr:MULTISPECIES: metallophosphoesterase [Bacteroidales]ROT18388.1 serine/threonine protein phosphatase [Muribaculaceae bacterium Isolate-114 (HZI)]ROT19209.1 serine/threonine protein phosphatase [Muribaculaceae bacterium Isolate-113 (HZI)]